MKNLKHHKKQIKQHQSKNRFNEWANTQLDLISIRIRTNYNNRMNNHVATLQQSINQPNKNI